jgi:hypothetical protein
MARTFCQDDVAFNRGATTALIGAGTGIAASGALMADPSLLGIGIIQAGIGLVMAGLHRPRGEECPAAAGDPAGTPGAVTGHPKTRTQISFYPAPTGGVEPLRGSGPGPGAGEDPVQIGPDLRDLPPVPGRGDRDGVGNQPLVLQIPIDRLPGLLHVLEERN